MERIGPLSNVVAYWDHDLGGYPERVRLAMADGSIQTFWLEVNQPEPQTEYVGKHIKRPAVLQHQPATEEKTNPC